MKVSFLLIILGFSQVLGRNWRPLREYTCGHLEKNCFSDEDCKNCSNCPNGAACGQLFINMRIFSTCECRFDNYENSLDYINAKPEQIQSEKAFDREMVTNNFSVDSE